MFIFSSHGISLTGLPFPPSLLCPLLFSCDVSSDLVYIDVCRIWLPTMRSEIFCSLSSLDFVTDGRNFDCLPQLR